jgi:hypothetical protein
LPPGTTKLLYQNDFEVPTSNFPARTYAGGDVTEYAGGEYRVHVKRLDTFYRQIAPPLIGDFHAEVQARYEGAGSEKIYGLIFRQVDSDNFYALGVNAVTGKYRLLEQKNGFWSTILGWTFSPSIIQGPNPNILTVVARGQLISLYANGVLLNQVTVNTSTAGRIGLYTLNLYEPDGVIAYYDNLRVFELR